MGKDIAAGTAGAPARTILKAVGFTDDDSVKPLIGIITARGEISPGGVNLGATAENAKTGVAAAGGAAAVVSAPCICAQLSTGHAGNKYVLPSRELLADAIECMAAANGFDGLLLIPDGDACAAGMLMGAARCNLPSLILNAGIMPAGEFKGAAADFNAVCRAAGAAKAGKLNTRELKELENSACPSFGEGAENGMSRVAEALGMALPGNGSVSAVSAERTRLAKEAGAAAVELVNKHMTPRKIMNKEAFAVAAAYIAAAGSPDDLLHLLALGAETGVKFDIKIAEKILAETPCLARLDARSLALFHGAGGVSAVLGELYGGGFIKGDPAGVSGKKASEIYSGRETLNENAIRPAGNPYYEFGGVAVLYGNIAEDGCVARLPHDEKLLIHKGAARVFDCEEDALAALNGGRVSEGDILVVRYEGPKGGPGMREMRSAASLIAGMNLASSVVLLTDGRVPAGIEGAHIGHACPEAADGGKIAALHDGDIIEINYRKGKIEADVSGGDFKGRMKKWHPKDDYIEGYLARYRAFSSPASSGASFKKKF